MTTGSNTPRARRPALLGQIVAVVGGAKTRSERVLTDAHHAGKKVGPLSGISRTYQPLDDAGETLPPESTRVQIRAGDLIETVRGALSGLLDAVATQEWGNTQARADVVVEGNVLLAQVPVTYLMWVEKQLVNLRTFVADLPTLDLAEEWLWDDNARAYLASAVQTSRTKKIPRNHVLSAATDRHPAQVQVWQEDVVVGTWTTVKAHGGLPEATVRTYVARVDRLIDAVKVAREAANTQNVEDIPAGGPILGYVFA